MSDDFATYFDAVAEGSGATFANGEGPRVHRFTGLTSGEAYNRTQCDEAIRDGDVLVVPANRVEQHNGIVGVMVEAWPIVVHGGDVDGTDHAFHLVDDMGDFLAHSPRYRESVELARITAA